MNEKTITALLFVVALVAVYFAITVYAEQYRGVQEAWQFAAIHRVPESSSDVSTEDATPGCIAEPSYGPGGVYLGCSVRLRGNDGAWHQIGVPASELSESGCKTFCSFGWSNDKKLLLLKDYILYENPKSDLK